MPHDSPGRFLYNLGHLQLDVGKLSQYSEPVKAFIIRHELAHYFTQNEREADRIALLLMANEGWSLANTLDGVMATLRFVNVPIEVSAMNLLRIKSVYDELKTLNNLD